ncbi:poly(ADP-ribose) glycohydrolase-like isoform X2 [Coccinella septempunctata]|nr:poly(ADP-ribose) glycohydrolase-like isoform X2 [Coccinella septempunctata]
MLPKIIQLALRLPEIVPGSIPLLKKHHSKSVSLSQVQVSSLLANAFLCTFPWRKNVSSSYPGINFIRLYISSQRPRYRDSVAEKIKCILHYFRRVTKTEPKGVITVERRFLHKTEIPRWDTLQNNLGNTRVHIANTGTIEDDGLGFLQIDFANKYVGGGVLGYGCVQEEIRFVICPELLITRLFIEQLDDTEAVIVRGVERFSKYTGYGETFKWDGNYVDNTPFDIYCRRQTTISIIDATLFWKADQQYYPSAIIRELNKAYVGFSSHHTDNLAPVATGNWGCGAFNGDVKLKMLIQLIACNAAHRDLVYYTFGNEELQETLYSMYLFIANNKIKTGELWKIFCRFAAARLQIHQFYSFIQQCWFDIKDNPTIISDNSAFKLLSREGIQYYGQSSKRETSPAKSPLQKLKKDHFDTPTTSKPIGSAQPNFVEGEIIPFSQERKEHGATLNNDEILSSDKPRSTTFATYSQSNSNSDSIAALHPKSFYSISTNKFSEKTKFNKKFFEKSHTELLNIFSTIDGPPIGSEAKEEVSDTLLTASDKWLKEENTVKEQKMMQTDDFVVINMNENTMEIEENHQESESRVLQTKNKITDYFSKSTKS